MSFTYKHPRPAVTTDVVPFAWRNASVQVLLIRRQNPPFQNTWALPGGFLDQKELVEECARRELQEETGLTHVQLHFVRYADQPDRDPRGRTITFAFLGLVPYGSGAAAGDDAAAAGWHSVRSLPPTAFDHRRIVHDAWLRLRELGSSTTALFALLPSPFTLNQALAVYEAVFERAIPADAFHATMLGSGILRKTEGERGAAIYALKARADDILADRGVALISS